MLEGELTVKRAGETGILREGETVAVEADVWHDWWNASDRDPGAARGYRATYPQISRTVLAPRE